MARVGTALLSDAKAALAHGDQSGAKGRDLLSLLVHANTAEDIPASQRLSDKDVLARACTFKSPDSLAFLSFLKNIVILAEVPTFLVAGHETTSTATSWTLYCLTQHPNVQRKLREELMQVSTDSPSMEELNGLHYLDHVVREVLRLYAPVPMMMREAAEDDVIPLDTPIVDKHGRMCESVRQVLYRPIVRQCSTLTGGSLESTREIRYYYPLR